MLKLKELIAATGGVANCRNNAQEIKNFSTDSRNIKKGDMFIALRGENFDGHDFIEEVLNKGAMGALVCQDWKSSIDFKEKIIVKVRNTITALGDIACFKRKKYNIPVIAVTGSNGKTTTKEMLAASLSAKYKVLKNQGTKNNHIGLPQALLELDETYDLAVLELGTNHFNEIKYLAKICLPNIGIITNIGQSHLEFFKDLEGVYKEKISLFDCLQKPGIGLLNLDDQFLRKAARKRNRTNFILSYAIEKEADFKASEINCCFNKTSLVINNKHKIELNTLGRYNAYNALAAVSIARLFGLSYEEIASQLQKFEFPYGRLKTIEFNDTLFIDDTYNANPLSFRAALSVLSDYKTSGRKILILGDMLELGEEKEAIHSQAGREASSICDVFITVGKLSRYAASAAKCAGLKDIFSCSDLNEAKEVLFNRLNLKSNDVVLIKGSRSMKMEEIIKNAFPSTVSLT